MNEIKEFLDDLRNSKKYATTIKSISNFIKSKKEKAFFPKFR